MNDRLGERWLCPPQIRDADAEKIRFFLRSAPWHEFNFCAHTHREIRVMRQRLYKTAHEELKAARLLRAGAEAAAGIV
jgi:hypothetical protein